MFLISESDFNTIESLSKLYWLVNLFFILPKIQKES